MVATLRNPAINQLRLAGWDKNAQATRLTAHNVNRAANLLLTS